MRTAGKLALVTLMAAPLLVVGPNAAGGDAKAVAALRAFVEVSSYEERFHLAQAPELEQAITAFWDRWYAGDQTGAVLSLKPQFPVPGVIRSAADTKALWAQAMSAAVDMLWHQSGGAGAAAWADRQRLDDYAGHALASGNPAPNAGNFLDDAKAAFDRWVGLDRTRSVDSASTVTGAPAGDDLKAVVDGSLDTAYRAGASPVAGDMLTVGAPRARPTDRVVVVGSGAATVEARTGGAWRRIGSLRDGYTPSCPLGDNRWKQSV